MSAIRDFIESFLMIVTVVLSRGLFIKEQQTARKSSVSWEEIRAGKISHLVYSHSMQCLPMFYSGIISHAQTGLHAYMFSVLHKTLSKKVNQNCKPNYPANLPKTHWHSRVTVILHLTSCVLCVLSQIMGNLGILDKTL